MISIPSFAKINLGLKIGPARADGFHELRTVYQTLALHDIVRVELQEGEGIEIRCSDPRVPLDASNTCYKIAERVLELVHRGRGTGEPQVPRLAALARNDNLKSREGDDNSKRVAGADNRLSMGRPAAEATPLAAGIGGDVYGTAHAARVQHEINRAKLGKIVIEIEKRLPVQGGMGAASSNAVAAMLAMERVLDVRLSAQDKLRIAAAVGSDLPLFLMGGTVLGVGRGEEVFPLPDLPSMPVVIVTPSTGVSTPRAFQRWDERNTLETALTGAGDAGTINEFSQHVFAWLGAGFPQVGSPAVGEGVGTASGVPAKGGNRAETPLLDLVRAGIENDFEKVVFPEYPDLREVKAVLLREGARYASLSGSGSTLYGLFATQDEAHLAAARMSAAGHAAVATTTLTREQYWKATTSN